jgi:hypothetical protein
MTSASSIPVGAWRDGVCERCNYGVCLLIYGHHGFVLYVSRLLQNFISVMSILLYLLILLLFDSFLVFTVAAGQVINRLKFSWRGTPSHTTAEGARAFAVLFYITVTHWILFGILELSILTLYPSIPVSDPIDYDHYLPPMPEPEGFLLAIIWVYDILKLLYVIITIVLLFQLRRSVRAKFVIPGSVVCDCCCSYWCPCLVAGQMLRHTTDYDVYPSQLCSSTGLSSRLGPMAV